MQLEQATALMEFNINKTIVLKHIANLDIRMEGYRSDTICDSIRGEINSRLKSTNVPHHTVRGTE